MDRLQGPNSPSIEVQFLDHFGVLRIGQRLFEDSLRGVRQERIFVKVIGNDLQIDQKRVHCPFWFFPKWLDGRRKTQHCGHRRG